MKIVPQKERVINKDPIIVTINGKAFSSFTKDFKKPYDDVILDAMKHAVVKLCEEVQNVKLVYCHSDEITLVLTAHESDGKQHWYNGSMQEIGSAAASIATYHFNDYLDRKHWLPRIIEKPSIKERKPAHFVSTVSVSQLDDLPTLIIQRQRDAINESVKAYAATVFNKRELMNEKMDNVLKGMSYKGIDWNTEEPSKRHGFCCYKEVYSVQSTSSSDNGNRSRWVVDENVPNFAGNNFYLEKHLAIM